MEYDLCKESEKKVFAIACLGIKLDFHTEICYYFEKFCDHNFKNRSISSGPGVVQI